MAYKGRMISGYGDEDTPAEARLVHQFIRTYAGQVKGNIVFIDVNDNKQQPEGTSMSNPRHARVVAWLVAEMHHFGLAAKVPTKDKDGRRASILVMSPYQAQGTRLNWAIGSLSRAEYCAELVDV
jgi:hypothetical protein